MSRLSVFMVAVLGLIVASFASLDLQWSQFLSLSAMQAMGRFEAFNGPLKPHFAYGELDKAAYTRAHLMHLANHWQQLKG